MKTEQLDNAPGNIRPQVEYIPLIADKKVLFSWGIELGQNSKIFPEPVLEKNNLYSLTFESDRNKYRFSDLLLSDSAAVSSWLRGNLENNKSSLSFLTGALTGLGAGLVSFRFKTRRQFIRNSIRTAGLTVAGAALSSCAPGERISSQTDALLQTATAIHSGDITPSPESAIYRIPLADTRVEKTPTGYTIATITPEQTPSPTLTVTEEINLKVSTDTWSTDSNGQINKEIMAEVVNRALIEDKYAFDMKLGPINVAIVEDEDLTEVNAQILVEKRNKVKDEFDDGLMNRCLSQILKFMPELRKELRDRKLNLSDSQIIIERDYDGELQVTNIIVNGLRMFMSDPQGELFRVPDRTPENRQFYGLDNVIPMFPDLKVEERKYIFSSSDHMIDEYLPPPREDSRIIVVDDPTGILGGKVFQSEIFSEFIPDNGIPNDNDRHRSYYPGPYRDPFNPPHSENQDDVGWEMPIEMTATIYFDLLEFDIGVNVHELGSRVAGEGKQIYAMAGDYHVPFPGLPPDYHEDRPATNTLLAKHEEKLYILPMSHDQDNQFFIGSFVNLNASIPEKKWVQFKTISTKDGIWTLMRLYGTNRYRVMGYVKNYNPDMPAFSVNFGPYALPTVSSFRAYQQDLNVSSWGDVVYFPPGGPQP